MDHSCVVSLNGLYYHHLEHRFSALQVEDALEFDEKNAEMWVAYLLAQPTHQHDDHEFVIEYRAGAVAREDQEYQAQLADLRG